MLWETFVAQRIAIIGAGAVGGYVGAYLARAGQDVTAFDAWPDHVEAIRRDGIRLTGMTEADTMTVRLPTRHLSELQGLSREAPIDIAIMAVKSYDTVWGTAAIAPYLAPSGFVLSAQNCVNEERIAGVVGWGRVLGCMVGNNFTVDLHAPGEIRRTMPRMAPGTQSLQIGEVHGRVTARAEALAALLADVDTTGVTTNLWGVRWSKLCVNGMRNGVSAATGLGGNARDAHPVIRRVVIRLAAEGVRVGRALGYELETMTGIAPDLFVAADDGDPEALARVEATMLAGTQGAARSDLQRPSMAQDIAKGRRTEIDFMNGFIAERAAEAGIPAPTHGALTAIVRKVERGALAARPENLLHL